MFIHRAAVAGVAVESVDPVGRVLAAGGVAIERIPTVCRVGDAGCVGNECEATGGGVVVATIWLGIYPQPILEALKHWYIQKSRGKLLF